VANLRAHVGTAAGASRNRNMPPGGGDAQLVTAGVAIGNTRRARA
jgi:hypothetical protein